MPASWKSTNLQCRSYWNVSHVHTVIYYGVHSETNILWMAGKKWLYLLENIFDVVVIVPMCIWAKFCRTGKKCSGCPKLSLTPRVAQPKRLVLETCPFGSLVNYISPVSGRIFTFLGCQETCAGKR